MSTPTQKFMKFQNGNTYEAGKTKKGELVIAGNVGGTPNPQLSARTYASITAATTTTFGRFIYKTGESTASTVTKRRDLEQAYDNIVASTLADRFRRSGK